MKISITGRKVIPKDAFKERAEKKLSKLDRFFDEEATAKVTVTVEKERQTVEITVSNRGILYRAEETTKDMLFSLDNAMDSLVKQINRNKARLSKRLKEGAFDKGLLTEAQDDNFDIVRVKQFAIKPMAVEEAILQMNLLGHEFYTFLDEQTSRVSVVYKRHDGRYGVLEPTVE